MKINRIDIGKKIKQIRMTKGDLQQDLAQKLGIKQSRMSKIESNLINIEIYDLLDICRIYNVSIYEFLEIEIPSSGADEFLLMKLRKLNDEQIKKLIDFIDCLC